MADRARPDWALLDSPESPASIRLAEQAASWRSAYVHIPFCRRRCPYCDFAVVTPDESDVEADRYVAALVAEISMEEPWGPLDAVNFGGGTPSTLTDRQLGTVLTALSDRFGIAADAEISLEANPEDVTERYAADLVATGFTRISLGVQSLDGEILGVLGRHHAPLQARAATEASRTAGFGSVSIDLIYGAAGETIESWGRTVASAVSLQPDHLSAYALTVETGTALSRAIRDGAEAPDADHQADDYELLIAAAGDAGLVHYEVSNFARTGHPCRYNLSTWGQGEYVSFGLGAHGHRNGVRRRNVRRLDAYLARIEAGERPESGSEQLDEWQRDQERILLGLRRRCGVIPGAAGTALWHSMEGRRLIDAGILDQIGDRLVILDPLMSDAVGRAVLSVSPGEC